MLRKFKWNLLIMMILFSFLIILLLSFIDMNRMSKKLIDDYAVKVDLVEMNVIHSLKGMNQEYALFDKKIADKMKANSEYISKKYEKNDHFAQWDFAELKNTFGMDIYIINPENKVVYSSFKKDIGLDFKKCCSKFSRLLDERRASGQFVHDGIDLQQKTGELKKYSYMSTKDGKYIIELSYDLTEDPDFQKFDFLTVMKELKENYNFIEKVAIYNKDAYILREAASEDNLIQNRRGYLDWLEKDKESSIKQQYLKYHVIDNQGTSNSRLVEIAYSDDEIQQALLNNRNTFFIQFFGILILAIGLVFLITKIVEKPMYLAFHDRLTGLKNRAAFENEVNQRLLKKQKKFGILLMDLDNFKLVNDTLGHDKGDLLLKYVAAHIKSVLPHRAFFARFGGDEFVIVIDTIQDKDTLQKIAARIIDSINNPTSEVTSSSSELFLQGNQIIASKKVTVSIGGAIYPDDGDDIEILYKKADMALYSSKAAGKNSYTYYGDMEVCKYSIVDK